jgi:pyruvate kinase
MAAIEIIATLGPSSWKLAEAIAAAGASSFRINASHLSPEELGARLARVRGCIPSIPIVIDLQGAKMRLGTFAPRRIAAGEGIAFSLKEDEDCVPVPHPEIFDAVKAGETLSCDDDRLAFRISSVRESRMEAVCLSDGELKPRKGINVIEHPVQLARLSDFDAACIRAASGFDAIGFAFSFMKDGSESLWVKEVAPGRPVFGKIERIEAVENADRIAHSVEGIWICRGDLGAQIGPVRMARWISDFEPGAAPCPVFMAGQVLEHLTLHPEPTRSEICHLFTLVKSGYRGFVLSDETAIGIDPVRSVETLRRLVDAMVFELRMTSDE